MSNPFATPWTVVHQTPPSMGSPRQEYWSELPLTGIFLTAAPQGKRCTLTYPMSKGKASSTSILGEGKQVLHIYQKALTNLWQKQLLDYSFSLLGLQYIPC